MKIAITNVHLDLGAGRRGTDMGASAIHLAGLVPKLEMLGHLIGNVHSINPLEPHTYLYRLPGDRNARFLPHVRYVCERLRNHVLRDLEAGEFPLVLGGDHSQAIGTVSAIATYYRQTQGRDIGVIWVDAHTDMNTPETSPTGNIHGMPLATLLGIGHPELVNLNPEGISLDPKKVVIVGARDVDPSEVPLVRELGVRCITMSEIDLRGAAVCFQEALEIASGGDDTAGIHLSFDLDGVDPIEAPGVGTPVPGGLSLREAHTICEMVGATRKMVGMEVVELNPTLDHSNKTGQLAVWLILSALGKTILHF